MNEDRGADGRRPARILIVEDDRAAAHLFQNTLASPGREILVASTAAAAVEALYSQPVSLIVLDLVLPDADGRGLLASLRGEAETANVPVVVVTVRSGPAIRDECLGLGAAAFFEKPIEPETLEAAVSELLGRPVETEVSPRIDPLTGLANRAGIREAYDAARASMPPSLRRLCLALIDIDRFRAVNESCGKEIGDQVIHDVAMHVAAKLHADHVLGRWRGDRFVAVMPGADIREAAEMLQAALLEVTKPRFASEQGGIFGVTFSAGVADVADAASIDEAIIVANAQLYLAKTSGRARVVTAEAGVAAPTKKVLLADDDEVVARIVVTRLAQDGLEVLHSTDGVAALEVAGAERIGLFILDVNMPRMDGFELLGRLREDPRYARVPIVMLTSLGEKEDLARAFQLGADDYIVKPVSVDELVTRVRRLLTGWVQGRLQELEGTELYARGLNVLGAAFGAAKEERDLPVVDLSKLALRIVAEVGGGGSSLLGQVMNPTVLEDYYLAQHSLNSAVLATIVGAGLELRADELENLCLAALLHEIGSVRLPEGLFLKKTAISDAERQELQRRPEYSREIIGGLGPTFAPMVQIAGQVHERVDGTGYPRGLSGDEICLEAQILSAVEVYEALTHDRPYRDQPQTASEAAQHLLQGSNTQFLEEVLKVLLRRIGLFPMGSYVKLSTDEIARVMEHREGNLMRPLLAVVTDRAGAILREPRVLDPMLSPQVSIVSSVPPPQIEATG